MTEYKPKSEFLRTIIERGFFHQCTDLEALDKELMQEKPMQKTAYIGFDATADSLHVGSLMQIMMLRWFQKCGHRPIVLMGGGTTKVGDPSGKDETRQLLDNEAIDNNIKGIRAIFVIRRVDGASAFGLTTPLLTKADGSKMGKTASGAIWLNEDKLSAYDFWQFWRNTMDEDVGKFLKLFTKLDIKECEKLGALEGQELNEAKIILANAVCAMCHGEEATKKAKEAAGLLFEEGNSIYKPPLTLLEQTMTLSSLLVNLEFAKGGKDAKRLIAEGIVLINDEVIKDPQHKITLDKSEPTNVSIGKKRQARVMFNG